MECSVARTLMESQAQQCPRRHNTQSARIEHRIIAGILSNLCSMFPPLEETTIIDRSVGLVELAHVQMKNCLDYDAHNKVLETRAKNCQWGEELSIRRRSCESGTGWSWSV